MGSPLAGDPTIWPPEVLICDDGDPPNGSTFGVGQEALTHRTAHLYARIGEVYDRTTPLPDLAALVAIVAPTNKMTRLVERLGWFVFDASSVDTLIKPYALAAADGTPGRWVRAGHVPHFRERGVDLSRCLIGRGNGAGEARIPRDKNAPFHPAWQVYYTDGSMNVVRDQVFAKMQGGMLVMALEPLAGVGSYGFQWCIDDVLGSSDQLIGSDKRDLSKLLGVYAGFFAATGRAALPTTRQVSIGCFRSPRGPSSLAAPALESLSAAGDFTEFGAVDVAEYEGSTLLSMSCNTRNEINLAKYTYYVQVWNEEGANSLANNGIGYVVASVASYYDVDIGGVG